MSWPGRYFTLDEIGSPPADLLGNAAYMVAHLDQLRARHGHPIRVTSGYRLPEHNERIGGSATSDHVRALAVDIASRRSQADLWQAVEDLLARGWPVDQAIRYHPDVGGHIHLGWGPQLRGQVLYCYRDVSGREQYTPARPAWAG